MKVTNTRSLSLPTIFLPTQAPANVAGVIAAPEAGHGRQQRQDEGGSRRAEHGG
jgi:hypothetical protein